MDDSDQDFVDLCSKLLKRVRKKPGEARQPRKAEHQPASQAGEEDKRRKTHKKDGDSGSKLAATQPVSAGAQQHVVSGGAGHDSGDAGSSVVLAAAGQRTDRGQRAKDKVLLRMQQFKRASPQKMVHKDKTQPVNNNNNCTPFAQQQIHDAPESFTSGLHPEPPDSDEALAQQLQQVLDREAAEAHTVDLEDRGLYFCQICHRDLSHMTPEGRTQHLNRCLDKSEESAPAPPSPPSVPDCPICGKKFKSQKSRSAHLKRCSSDMGVSPAVLLQVLQRQAEESQSAATANTLIQTVGTKRKGLSKPGHPASKKPRKKTEPLDEETMVALALSSSLLEQKAERHLQAETAASHISMTPALKWRPDAVKGRGKRKKGAIPRPPPLLLVQDAETALTRLQERVSALLLHSRAPSPPTPTHSPSTLPGWSGTAPLWHKSTLQDGGSTCPSDFYAPELREFFTPWESVMTNAASFSTSNKPESSVRPVGEGTPVTTASSSAAPSTPGAGQLLVGSQSLRDLVELAEDGMTLTQYGHSAEDKQINAGLSTNLRLSGFIQEQSEEQVDLHVSGFLPETAQPHSEDTCSQAMRTAGQSGADKYRGSHQSVALSRLASDLSSMVNNPQLSDVQLQVDSGEVYFAHSFMVYARCPLLAEMVHESGFGVQEEGVPAAQRVLMSDVPGQAVFALLQYLYTSDCSIPASLQPDVMELASRLDLQELQQLCRLPREEADDMNQEENVNSQTDQAFMELFRSMWNEEDEDDDGAGSDGGKDEGRRLEEDCRTDEVSSGDREICEEQMNEEELEEIYEFAATQRRREEKDSEEEERVDEEEDGEAVFTKLTEPKIIFNENSVKPNIQLEPDPSLDRSYSRLFSDEWGVYEEGGPPSSASTSGLPKTHTRRSKQQPPHKPSSDLSARTLLQSSASVVDDLSLSPPTTTSNLPIPGLSPGQVPDFGGNGDKGEDAVEPEVPLKRESQGPRSICVPLSPDSPQKKEEPELIVLSDSSEEMDVDVAVLSSCSPSPHSPYAVQNLQSYTDIKARQIPTTNEPSMENKEFSNLKLSPGDPADCSPEVSWLIPSTPVQRGSSTKTSSTQTNSSMCRTRLFPKGDTSPPSSSVFSCSASPFKKMRHTSSSPTRVSARSGQTETSVSRLKLDRTAFCSSSLDLNFSPERSSSYASKDRKMMAAPPSQSKLSYLSSSTHSPFLQASFKQGTPLHLESQPYSSTPLNAELPQPSVLFAASRLHTDPDKQKSNQRKERAPSDSPEKIELGSFHLSPVFDPSDPPSSSSHSSLQSAKRHHKSSSQSRRSVESSGCDNTGAELTRRGKQTEEGGRKTGCDSKDMADGGEQEEVKGETGAGDVAESSFQQSFMPMDEPPIAFNDSWGLDACAEANPGCFSLRLEDSGPFSQQERSPGQRETPSTSSISLPSPSSHRVQTLKSRGGVTTPSPPKGYSPQPSSSRQGPSPPDSNKLTTTEIDNGLLDSKIWDSWEEDEEEEAPPLSQRVNAPAQLKTPTSSRNKRRRTLIPITPMPLYSDMDTPDLKNKLSRFGVRPLPKRQMILKLKEIHQYTHQLVSSDSEDEAAFAGRTAQMKLPPSRPVSCAQTVKFKEPIAPAAVSPLKHNREDEAEPLSASQGSNTSSTAASEESERSNPELCISSDGDSDSAGGISSSQAACRLQDRLQAVRAFILSDAKLYSQILHYHPLVLSQLQEQLKAAGIRLGAAKLVDYLDSQCITFTTAKPGHAAPSRRRGKATGKGAKAAGEKGVRRKRVVAAVL